jgi:hypothetical protein
MDRRSILNQFTQRTRYICEQCLFDSDSSPTSGVGNSFKSVMRQKPPNKGKFKTKLVRLGCGWFRIDIYFRRFGALGLLMYTLPVRPPARAHIRRQFSSLFILFRWCTAARSGHRWVGICITDWPENKLGRKEHSGSIHK